MASVQDIYDEITRIDNAKQGIAEAIEEKGVQVPEESRIGEYPGLVRQIQTGSPDAVLYTPQELTPEQQEQARENIGAGTYTKPDTGIPKSDFAPGVQTSLENADTALQPAALTPITELIPAQATPQNQLADKNFVNSSVATNTANYISDNGQPFQSVEDLEAYTGQLTNNDYAFVVGTDSAGNTTYTRYKYNANTQTWAAEYVLNNSSFTAAQWAAISSGITALLVQKLSDLPTEVVTYVAQTLTEAQKQQARTNIGATAPEVFWATYGTTTFADVTAAVNAGKMVACLYGGGIYIVGNLQSSYCYFYAIAKNTFKYLVVQGTASWSVGQVTGEVTTDKVQTLSGNETSTTKYPATKAVADALGKMGVVSQTQTWRSNAAGWTYTMTNIVRGIIPQYFIDEAETIGATFNETTGYFELNGLTDISYKEMVRIVMFPVYFERMANANSNESIGNESRYGYLDIRTNGIFMSTSSTIGLGKCDYLFYGAELEIINMTQKEIYNNTIFTISGPSQVFYACRKLRKIIGAIKPNADASSTFLQCFSLEDVRLTGVRYNVSFVNSSLLSIASVVFLVDYAANTTAITITLHATAYGRCQADTTEYTYEGQTYTGIIAYAAAKNITIASA